MTKKLNTSCKLLYDLDLVTTNLTKSIFSYTVASTQIYFTSLHLYRYSPLMNNKKHRDLRLSAEAFSLMNDNYYDRWEEYENLYNSQHPEAFIEAAKKLERSHLFIPIAKSTIDILDAIFSEAFFSQGNPIEIVKNEDEESKVKSVLSVLVAHYYKESKPYVNLGLAFSSASRYGLGAVFPYWCSKKNMPITKFIPPTSLAFDTEAVTRDENQYLCYKFKQTFQDIIKKTKTKFYDSIKVKDLDKILGSGYGKEELLFKRKEVTEVYSLNDDGEHLCRSFINGKKVREKTFKSCPVKHGYLTAVMPSVVDETREDQCACIGESVLGTIEPLVKELNQKRNQIVDINEQIIDPYTLVGDGADITASDAAQIKGPVNVGNPAAIVRLPPQSTFALEKEIATILSDIDDATAINGMQRGQTSSSDRRAAAAMAIINANSSSRLSKMAITINNTLFNPWAEAFVREIYVNVSDETVLELCGEDGLEALGRKGTRQEIKYVVSVNFGKSINRDVKISELTMVLQMLNGRKDADIMPILVELLKLILGDNFDAKKVFTRVLGDGGNAGANPTDGGQGAGAPVASNKGLGADATSGYSEVIPGEGYQDNAGAVQNPAAVNQI